MISLDEGALPSEAKPSGFASAPLSNPTPFKNAH